MASKPDHNAGIDRLPKWDPNNLGAGYRYDWREPYSRSDYNAFRLARKNDDAKRYAKAQADLRRTMKNVGNIVAAAIGHNGGELTIDVPSECFSSVSWQDGIVTGVFARNGATYSAPMDLQTFLEIAETSESEGSLGKPYNRDKYL